MTNDQRHALEEAVLAYGAAKAERMSAIIGGDERQEGLAACYEADAWEAVQDALDDLEKWVAVALRSAA